LKIIKKINQAIEKKTPFYSFEYFPPKTPDGLSNLYDRIARMGEWHPIFVDITWGAGGSTAGLSFDIAKTIQNLTGLETMMHLTCLGMGREEMVQVLATTRQKGIQNILALRGDPPRDRSPETVDEFRYAIELVRFIRELHGDFFGICVAAYPEGHSKDNSYEQELSFLKEKVDAGADFIVTQLVFDVDIFLRFLDDCRHVGIDCPILPGLMPIHNYRSFSQISRFAASIPKAIVEQVERLKDDDQSIKDYGVEVLSQMVRRLYDEGVPGVHFYTLNLEQVVTRTLQCLHVNTEKQPRALPWERSASARREGEDVRPIFWSNRPKSYLARTMDWDEFPNGRWGDSRSPAFGEPSDYYLARPQVAPASASHEAELRTEKDVFEIFTRFCLGVVRALPWFEGSLALESDLIRSHLVSLNRHGFLTLNSQPMVNGAPSDDAVFGWGGSGGYVYQKAYVEFFVSGRRIEALLEALKTRPSMTYQAIDAQNHSFTNCSQVNAVTWGVFPGREIIQPTVVDPVSFQVWKDEAFSYWLRPWAEQYPEQSEARMLLQHIHDNYFLVNIVENDFVKGDLWGFCEQLVAQMGASD
jgi:methylenetetrahydrofolate reductase (NADPH)